MGIFNIFRKKKEKKAPYEYEMESVIAKNKEMRKREQKTIFDEKTVQKDADLLRLEEVDVKDEAQRREYIQAYCDLMVASDEEIENQKKEYQQINDCLADIQEFLNLPEEVRGSIGLLCDEAARLSRQRKQSLELGKNRLPENKYLRFSQYREEMPKTLRKLEEEERHFAEIKSDLQKLEGERAVIAFQKKSLIRQRANLRGLSYILVITLLLIFLILFALKVVFEKDIYAGYLLSVAVVAVATGGTFFYLQKNNKDKTTAAKQMNRLITLLNKVKIKYVNSKNAIDYIYKKFEVNSSHELRFEWEEYQQMKREQEASSRYGRELAELEEDLAEMLSVYPIRKIDLWVRRCDILTDAAKMEQERELLEKQRRQLQESMSYNADTRQNAKEALEGLVKQYPEYGLEVLDFVEKVDRGL